MSKISDAVEAAGKKFSGEDARKLKAEGFLKEEIRKVAEGHGNVGEKLAGRLDVEAGTGPVDDGPQRVQHIAIPGSAGGRLLLNEDGDRLIESKEDLAYLQDAETKGGMPGSMVPYNSRFWRGGFNASARINDFLDAHEGFSLTPGKKGNRPIVAWKHIGGGEGGGTMPSLFPSSNQTDFGVSGPRQYIPIYGRKLKQRNRTPEEPAEESSGGGEQASVSGNAGEPLAGGRFEEPARSTWDTERSERGNSGESAGVDPGAGSTQISTDVFGGYNPLEGTFNPAVPTAPSGGSSSYPRPISGDDKNSGDDSSDSSDSSSSSSSWSSVWDDDSPSWRDSADDSGTAFAGSAAFRNRLSRMALA